MRTRTAQWLKRLLRIMQDAFEIQACCIEVLIAPAEAVFFACKSEQTKSYSLLQATGKDESGPPHMFAYTGLVAGLVADKEKVWMQDAQKLVAHQEAQK